jgi:hypothetical protein
MPKYYYVVDTGITSTRNGESVAVGQTTYDLLLDEKFEHGVYPETTGPGAGTTWAATDSPPGTQIGIHTTQKVGIGGTALIDFNLTVHGSANVGLATIGIATFGGSYETVRPNDKILSPSNNDVALTEIGGNGHVAIDVSQETVAIGTVGTMPRYDFTNVSLENKRMCTVSVIGLGSGPTGNTNVSAGTTYTINGGSLKYITWATASTPQFDSSHYNIFTFRILQDSVGLTSVFAVKE